MTDAQITVEERNAEIVRLRAEGGLTLAEIGQRFGLSGTRIYRILKEGAGGSNGSSPAAPARPKIVHRCATPGCDRPLKSERWIYSSHTGLRYCWTGEGCWKWSPEKRARMRDATATPTDTKEES